MICWNLNRGIFRSSSESDIWMSNYSQHCEMWILNPPICQIYNLQVLVQLYSNIDIFQTQSAKYTIYRFLPNLYWHIGIFNPICQIYDLQVLAQLCILTNVKFHLPNIKCTGFSFPSFWVHILWQKVRHNKLLPKLSEKYDSQNHH